MFVFEKNFVNLALVQHPNALENFVERLECLLVVQVFAHSKEREQSRDVALVLQGSGELFAAHHSVMSGETLANVVDIAQLGLGQVEFVIRFFFGRGKGVIRVRIAPLNYIRYHHFCVMAGYITCCWQMRSQISSHPIFS